jgi:UPF0755 protein
MSTNVKKGFATSFILLSTLAFLIITHIYIYYFTPPSNVAISKTILIPKGASFSWVARKLKDDGMIRSISKFTLFAKLKGVLNKVKAGEYELNTAMPPNDVLKRLVKGTVKEYKTTIPEGYNLYQIAYLLEDANLVKSEDFINKAFERDFLDSLNIKETSAEGYLFPDTYRFTKSMKPEDIIRKMVSQFNLVYSEGIEVKAKELGFSKKFIVTMASIIEKETSAKEEKALISAVFRNRLKKGMRLQSDPTVIYGIKDFDGNLRKKDLSTLTPYNTYMVSGIPPGPISNPGRLSLLAVLSPAKEQYLYFVSRNDGTHQFSNTFKEHGLAVATYQKKK